MRTLSYGELLRAKTTATMVDQELGEIPVSETRIVCAASPSERQMIRTRLGCEVFTQPRREVRREEADYAFTHMLPYRSTPCSSRRKTRTSLACARAGRF